MPKLRVHNFTVSLDGFGAGPNQSLEEPMGVGAEHLHEWMFKTRFWHDMVGEPGGEEGVDNDFAVRGDEGIGASIVGRNMFAPSRGAWPNDDWRGWWGDNPPYHHQVFVLTHHPRDPIPMDGGTTFNFVTSGHREALRLAFEAAGGKDVRVVGGASTIQQYLRDGLLDELHMTVSPIMLGDGVRLLDNLGSAIDGYRCVDVVTTPSSATHVRLVRR